MATQGPGADICDEEIPMPLAYASVGIQGGETTYADSLGNFVITNAGTDSVLVTSQIRGQWFTVNNVGGPNAIIDTTISPDVPVDILHNEQNVSELNRAEVNGYVQANIVRDYVLKYSPSYPGLQQTGFPVNVNLNDNCNAYYDYSSINFFTSGGGCANTAFSTVVHHEYGHHLVAMAGSGQGQYGEGMGDVMGVLITEDPELAYGFQNNCASGIRSAENMLQYPCSGQIHYCGQLLSACVWHTRAALMPNYPDDYMDIISSLAINAMPMHSGDMITPSITIDYLTLDDDDGNIYNGTPHYDEICEGFNQHNMTCPEVHLIEFIYPDGHPELIDPAGGTTIGVEVIGVIENPVAGTGVFHYLSDSGWVAEALTTTPTPNVYTLEFPAVDCGDEFYYYFSAQTDMGNTVTDPSGAPDDAYYTISALGFNVLIEDNFETNLGWTVEDSPGLVDGTWDMGIPVNCDRGDPPTDYDGSGQCALTDNSNLNQCNSDVDDGYTYLISPILDLSEGDAFIKFALWYSNNVGNSPNSDLFKIYVSDNAGMSWTLVETIGPLTVNEWIIHQFKVGSFVTPNSNIMVRFEASDLGDGSVVEAGVDMFQVLQPDCGQVGVFDEDDTPDMPVDFALIGSYPNPFNANTVIKYAIPTESYVTIEIYDVMGRKLTTLVNANVAPGYHQVSWDANDNSTGVYFYKINAGEYSDTKKMMLIK
jgi:hypothetical protein